MCLTCVVCCIHPHDPPLVWREKCFLLPQDDAALYRHLVAILRLCLMRKCLLSDDTDELQGWVRVTHSERKLAIRMMLVYLFMDTGVCFLYHWLIYFFCLVLCSRDHLSVPQSHSQPVDSSASPVSRRAAHGASTAQLRAVPGGQHGLCAHANHVHGEASGLGIVERSVEKHYWELFPNTLTVTWIFFLFVCLNLRVIRSKRSSHRYSICWQRAAGPTEKHAITSDNM